MQHLAGSRLLPLLQLPVGAYEDLQRLLSSKRDPSWRSARHTLTPVLDPGRNLQVCDSGARLCGDGMGRGGGRGSGRGGGGGQTKFRRGDGANAAAAGVQGEGAAPDTQSRTDATLVHEENRRLKEQVAALEQLNAFQAQKLTEVMARLTASTSPVESQPSGLAPDSAVVKSPTPGWYATGDVSSFCRGPAC